MPFDRQPYWQLESVFRKAGEDRRANQVYLERRRVERENKLRVFTLHIWLLDWLYKLVANYGVRPFRLIAYGLALVLLGSFIFSQPDALEVADKRSAQVNPAPVRPAAESLDVSIH